MTLQEIKDQIAKEEGYSNWKDVMKHQFPGPTNRMMDEVAKRYASECCKSSLLAAAEDAEATYEYIDGHIMPYVRKESIDNPKNIVLL